MKDINLNTELECNIYFTKEKNVRRALTREMIDLTNNKRYTVLRQSFFGLTPPDPDYTSGRIVTNYKRIFYEKN